MVPLFGTAVILAAASGTFGRSAVMMRVIMCFVLVGLMCTASSAYIETFSSGSAGWLATTVNDGGGNTWPGATWNSTGGNPDGDVSGFVSGAADRLYGLSPADASLYQGLSGTLTVDFKLDGTVTAPVGMKARFYIGTFTGGYNYFVSNDSFSWNPNMDTEWTTHQIALLAENFVEWPNQAAHTKTFAEVLAAPEDIGLVFADGFTSNSTLGFSGSGTISVDNFGTVPEPMTLGLLGLGGLLLRRRMA
jgi:hypothetical protein